MSIKFLKGEKTFDFIGTNVGTLSDLLEICHKVGITSEEIRKNNCDIVGISDLYLLLVPRLKEACQTVGYEAFLDEENDVLAVLDESKLASNYDTIKSLLEELTLEIIRKHPKKRKWSVWSSHKLSDGKRRKYTTCTSKKNAKRHNTMMKFAGG